MIVVYLTRTRLRVQAQPAGRRAAVQRDVEPKNGGRPHETHERGAA
jgi:hypothetical protein